MPRFTISHHTAGPEGDHYDLFLQVESTLKTWRFARTIFETPQLAVRIDDHRLQYLDHEGPVTRDRGQVKIWDTGDYEADVWTDDRAIVAMRGRQFKARLRVERLRENAVLAPDDADVVKKLKEGQSAWTAVDASVALRRLATTLLRESPLDSAPSAELQGLQEALLTEERAALVIVEAYAKARPVDWSKFAVDAALRERLQTERARWRHPWLDAAAEHAKRLDALAKLLQAAKPL